MAEGLLALRLCQCLRPRHPLAPQIGLRLPASSTPESQSSVQLRAAEDPLYFRAERQVHLGRALLMESQAVARSCSIVELQNSELHSHQSRCPIRH